MQFLSKISAFMVIGLSFAACSSGGDDVPDRNLGLLFGSTDPQQSRNGVDYADNRFELDDLEGQTFNVRVVRAVRDDETGEVRQETTDETVNFQDAENMTITLDGETLNLVNGMGRADDGDVLTLRTQAAGDNVLGFVLDKAAPVAVTISLGTSNFLIGAETNPDEIAALTGSVTYTAPLQINAVVGGPNSLSGDVTLEANFGSGMISGDVALASSDIDLGLDLAPVAINGNGFAGDLTCSAANCTSDSQIGGAFFGFDGEEIGGLIDLDVTTTDVNGATTDLIGTGVFVATEQLGCCD